MKEHLTIFLSFLVSISAHHEVHLIPAHIICPDVTADHDILLPDPHDCSIFYKCENGTAVPQTCPPGLAWCQILQNCTLPILANCTLSHTVVTYSPEELATYNPNTTTENPEPTGPIPSNETCPEEGVVLPNPEDCGKYKQCIDGVPVKQDCPKDKLFSTWLGICTDKDIADCVNEGTQENKTCPVNGEKRTDPTDCSKYYECVANSAESKQCPNGMEFNEWFQDCYSSDLAYCNTYTTVSPTTSPTTINTTSTGNSCPESGYKLPNPLDCHTYYVCSGNTIVVQECPEGMDYSCWDQGCFPPTLGQCSPTDGQTCNNPGEKLPNSENCSSYYECTKDGITIISYCGNGLEYNKWSKKCVNPSSAQCTVVTTTTPISTTSQTSPPPISDNICPVENAKLPDVFDCHSFFICKNNTPVQTECPEGENYSCWDQECLPVASANCINNVNQGDNCGNLKTTAPSTKDCSSYYQCENGKVDKQECADGLEFNAWFGECVDSSESDCQLHTTKTPNSTPTTSTQTVTKISTTTPPSPLCPMSGLIYPSYKYCNAYMKCDEDRQLQTIECDPSQFHYNCETKKCENITHCCSPTNVTMTPGTPVTSSTSGGTDPHVTDPGTPATSPPTGTGTHVTGPGTPATSPPTGTGTHVTGPGTPATSPPTGTGTHVTGPGTPATSHSPGTGTAGTKPPSIFCPPGSNGIIYPAYTDCHGYQICKNGQLQQMKCNPPEFNYNCETKKCENITHCCSPNHPSPTTSRPTTVTTIQPSTNDDCPYDGATLPNPLDCTSYYICQGNTPVPESCPSGQEYSCWDQSCVAANEATCIYSVQPGQSCSNNNDQLPNIGDCSSYYICKNGKTDLENCDAGSFYNKWFKKCVKNVSLSHCQTYPTPKPETPPTTIPPSKTENVCPFAGARLPNPMDCATYYVCDGNKPLLQNCPPGQKYSCWDQMCIISSEAKCITDTHPGDSCSINDLQLQNSENCDGFYKCQNGSVVTETCSSTTEYNPWYQQCLNPTYSHCQSIPNSPSTPTTTPSQITSTPSPNKDVCPMNGAKLPNPNNCNSYFICVNGMPEVQECPNGQEYSCWDQICETPDKAVCIQEGAQEEEPCSIEGEKQQNVEDCSTYYQCEGEKIKLKHCPKGTLYNKWFKECYNNSLAYCETAPTIKPSSTLVPPQTTIAPSSEKDVCPFEGASLPNPLDCTTYFTCLNNEPTLMNCPSGQGYSCWDQKCEDGAQNQCNPNDDIGKTCSIESLLLPKTGDCEDYLECENGTVVKQSCAPGTEYNQWFKKCVQSEYSHCQVEVDPNTTTPMVSTSKPTPEVCPLDGIKLPNPLDCKSYFTCNNGVIVSQECPSGEIYSCWDQECEIPQKATCINQGNQAGHKCSNNDSLPDIADCSSYLKCVNGTVQKMSCETGQIYNEWLKICINASAENCTTYTTVTVPASTTTSFPDPTGPILIYDVCPIEGALLPNPIDCSTYYKCINGTPTLESCPDGNKYSCWDQQCEADNEATCVTYGGTVGKSCKINGLRISDVTNCNNFLECDNGIIVRKQCPPEEEFNAAFQKCYSPALSHCQTYTTLIPSPITTSATTESPSSEDTCPFEGVLLPNPLNCSAFYECENGEPTSKLCADGYEYSCWDEQCVPEGEGHCISEGNQNGTSCNYNGKKIQNPEDCHSYYECVNGKVVLQKCDSNWYYNKWYGRCVQSSSVAHCTTSSTIPPTHTPKPTRPPITSSDICPIEGALLPNPLNCAEYYKCENDEPVAQTCPKGQEYSCWDQECRPATDAQCYNSNVKPGQSCSRDGVILQNSESCTSYFACKKGKVEKIYCFIGFAFNKWYQKCVPLPFAHCKTSSDHTTVSPTILPPGTCPLDGITLPNPLQCNSYFTCENGKIVSEVCPAGEIYSCWDQKCESPKDGTCINQGNQTGQKCSKDNELLPNIADCSSYYQCVKGKVQIKFCASGEFYNQWLKICVSASAETCITHPTVTEPSTHTTPVPDPTVPNPVNNVCPIEGALLPNPLDCTSYYTCIKGLIVPEKCPDGSKYSCWDQRCEKGGAVCVTDGPLNGETCSVNELKITDVSNCNNYYECDNGTTVRKHCPPGQEFNSAFQNCYSPNISHCQTYTTPEPSPTTTITPSSPTPNDTCPVDGALLPNPLNCSAYYKCENGVPIPKLCADGYEYSCWDEKCVPQGDGECIGQGIHPGSSCKNNGQTLQNPEDCHSYFKCKSGIVTLETCILNWYYNKWFHICVPFSSLAHCTPTGGTIPPQTTPKPTRPPSTSSDICPIDGALLPNPLNCAGYYKCENDEPVAQTCPSGQEYSCWDQECRAATDAQCFNSSVEPGQSCSRDGVKLQNPNNCASYYVCENGIVEEYYCFLGWEYNKWYQECVLFPFAHCKSSQVTTVTPAPTPTRAPTTDYDICPIEGTLLPNPVDCTSFYICVNGTPTIGKCGDGMEYSCWDQKCEADSDADCINIGSQVGANCSVEGLCLTYVGNCSNYYECINGKVVSKNCPPGLEFNDRFQKCYSPDKSHCTPLPTQAPPTGTVPPNTPKPTPQPGNDICPQEGTLLPNPLNCSQYYKCINGTPTPQLCADGYEYSCWDQVCEPAGEAQCIAVAPPPTATCNKNGVKNPDPTDCKKYTECVKNKLVTKTCPGNLWYNKWFKKCVIEILAHCNETTTIKPTPSTTTSAPTSQDTCPKNDAVIPDPTDCSSYYKCKKGKPTSQKCPKDKKYSPWDQECKKPSEVECINCGSPVGKSCKRDGVTIQNLEQCSSYFICLGGIVQEIYCIPLFQYNRWYGACELALFSHCNTYPTIAPPTTTTLKPVVTTVSYPGSICTENGKKAPKIGNCNQYYKCEGLITVLYNCPPGSNYDSWTQTCQAVDKAQCIDKIKDSCPENKLTVPDTKDCKKYNLCRGKKVRKESCPMLTSYDVWSGRCILSVLATCADKIVI